MAVNKTIILLKRILRLPHDLLCVLENEGSWKLSFPTDVVVEYFIDQCGQTDAIKIRSQLSQPFFQRTYNGGRINPIYYYLLDPNSLLDAAKYKGEVLYRIEMIVDGKKQMTHVEFVEGRLFSVELPKPIKFYKGKTISFGGVTKGKSSQSFTRAIDRAEHGRDPENN